MYRDFGTTLMFALLGIILLVVPLALQRILSPQRKTFDKLSTYECGEEVEGGAWIRFNIRFYAIALIFIIFEVEIVFMFPWAVVYKQLGLFAFVEMVIFLSILGVGLAYVWRKGDLEWIKLSVPYGRGRYRKLVEREESIPAAQTSASVEPSSGGERMKAA